jgi:hypothetical protein
MGDRAGTFLQLESTARTRSLTLEDIFAPDPEAGTAKRVKGDLVIRGSQFSYKSCKQAMVIVLRELAGLDSDLLQRCAQDPAFRGQKRRYLAQRVEDLFPDRPDRSR